MSALPFGAVDHRSAGAWFAIVTERLELLLGVEGARAVLCRALLEALKRQPELAAVTADHRGLDLSPLLSRPGLRELRGSDLDEPVATLAECLHALLLSLLGEELASELTAVDDSDAYQPPPSCPILLFKSA